MPYRSAKQRRYMHAQHPDIAARWDRTYGGKIQPSARKEAAHPHKRRRRKRKRHG